VQPSNTATITQLLKMQRQLMSWDNEFSIVCFVMLLALPKGEIHQEAEDIHNRWLEVLSQERVQYYDNGAKKE
jgi:hypothetical protein